MLPDAVYLRMLSREWTSINTFLLGGALLIAPTFKLSDTLRELASWNPVRREIRFSRSFVVSSKWAAVIEVMKHEMAHQFVSDVLGVEDETGHGPAFRMICDRYGIDARAAGTPKTDDEERVLDKVRKLFALGQSPNENEAKVAVAKARSLLEAHGLSETAVRGDDAFGDFGVVHPGSPVKPGRHHVAVSAILSKFFRVRCIWIPSVTPEGTSGEQLELCGRRCDLVVAEHVHAFLHAEALRLWNATGLGGKRDMEDFLEGVMNGFAQTLEQEQAVSRSAGASTELVHVGEADLNDYFDRRYPRRGSMRGSRRSRGAQFGSGLDAGRKIKIAKPLDGGPKLLGTGVKKQSA